MAVQVYGGAYERQNRHRTPAANVKRNEATIEEAAEQIPRGTEVVFATQNAERVTQQAGIQTQER